MSTDKETKRKAKDLWDRANKMLEYGDFATAGELVRKISEIAPDTDQGRQAQQRAEALRVDPGAIYALVGAWVLYAIAWAYALS